MITKAQALALHWNAEIHYGECKKTTGPRGGVTIQIERWRPNGSCQTWKTRPAEFRQPIKFGMRGYSQLTHSNAAAFHLAEDCPIKD
jgi:hypothetical protein